MNNYNLTIQNYSPDQIDQLSAFIERYRSEYPDAKLFDAGLYTYHPAAENGANAFCVYDGESLLRGFAPLFPAPVGENAGSNDPHHIWMILLADPTYEEASLVREMLLEPVFEQARILAARLPASRPTRLASDLMVSQREDIAFLEQNGFTHYDGMYMMRCELGQVVSEKLPKLSADLTLQRSKLDTESEQHQYLQAFNQCFPNHPKNLASLQFLLNSLQWGKGGIALTASYEGELIASIMTYPAESGAYAAPDNVFVLPARRGRGIAKALIAEGLRYAQAQGFGEICLEVMQDNAPAIAVYRSMGYEAVNQEVFLGCII